MKIIEPIEPYPVGASKVVYGRGQEQYLELPALRYNDATGTVCSFWKLSIRERILLMFRAVICLELFTFNNPIQPQRLSIYEGKVEEIVPPDLHIIVDRDGASFVAFWSDFENLQLSPAGFGDSQGEAVENLIKETGVRLIDAKVVFK